MARRLPKYQRLTALRTLDLLDADTDSASGLEWRHRQLRAALREHLRSLVTAKSRRSK
jgi:hypothetical protein